MNNNELSDEQKKVIDEVVDREVISIIIDFKEILISSFKRMDNMISIGSLDTRGILGTFMARITISFLGLIISSNDNLEEKINFLDIVFNTLKGKINE